MAHNRLLEVEVSTRWDSIVCLPSRNVNIVKDFHYCRSFTFNHFNFHKVESPGDFFSTS